MMRKKRTWVLLITAICLLLAALLVPDVMVVVSAKERIVPQEEAGKYPADCALVLGAGVRDGKPTPMLRDRLLTGIALYQSGAVKKILMSGDHGREDYDEVTIMKDFAKEHGVPDSDIFLDHAGFSTYESVYRAKAIFEVQTVIIVTQTYHLYRALYDAGQLGVTAYGVSADLEPYRGQLKRAVREILARDKDFLWCLFKPKPTYLGEKIPVSGDGRQTHE